MKKEVEKSIFRRGDIRGAYPKELNEFEAYKIGCSLPRALKSKKFVIGIDKRDSSKSLQESISKGIREQGANVIYIGEVDTPCVYFASNHFDCPGVIITASHNPLSDNGIKIVDNEGFSVGEKCLLKIKRLTAGGKICVGKKKGKEVVRDLSEEYKKHLVKFADKQKLKNLSVAVDSENGLCEKFLPYLFSGLNSKIKISFARGEKSLSREIVRKRADFGVSFDTDGDRMMCFDEKGAKVNNSLVGAMLINQLNKYRGGVVYIVPCSRIIPDVAKIRGLKSFRTKVGRTAVMLKMKEKKAILGVELSGHYYFKDNFYSDSGYVSLLKICEAYSQEKMKFSEMAKKFDTTFRSGEISLKCQNPDESIKLVGLRFKKDKSAKIDYLDGLTVAYKNWWLNLRKSGTENLIRLNVESYDVEELDRRIKDILWLLWENGCKVQV